jgi:hypothetical protein
MDRVDFLGVPGVGKTTLYARLRQRRHLYSGDWLASREAKVLVARHLARGAGRARPLMVAGLRVPRLREALTHHLLTSVTERALRASQDSAVVLELWEEIMAATLPPGERILAILPWVRRTALLALFREHLDGRTVVEDESYSKLASGFLTGVEAPVAVVREFFRRFPAPSAVIWIRNPESPGVALRLVRRVEKRGRDGEGRLRFGDRLWHEDELVRYVNERMRYDMEAVSVLKDRNVPVIEVSATEPLERQVEAVEGFLPRSPAPARSRPEVAR